MNMIIVRISVVLYFLAIIPGSGLCENKCLKLSTKGDHLKIPHNSAIDFTNAFTIEFWGYLNPGDYLTVCKRGNGGYYVNMREGRVSGTTFKRYDTVVKKSYPLNTWLHIAMTFDGKTTTLYVNGEYQTHKSGKKGVISTKSPIYVGALQNKNSTVRRFYSGTYDELRFWKRALKQSEIKKNMKKELTGKEHGLVAYYDFDELTGHGKVGDLTGRGNHAELMGNARLISSSAPVEPPHPPELHVSAHFADGNQNNVLDASEIGTIIVNVANLGKGNAKSVKAFVSLSDDVSGVAKNVSFETDGFIGDIRPGSDITKRFEISAGENLESGIIIFAVKASDSSGNKSPSVSLTIHTKARFIMPPYPADLSINDVTLIEPSGNNALDGYESGQIAFTLNNNGRGEAQNIKISVSPLSSNAGLSYQKNWTVERVGGNAAKTLSVPISAAGNVETLSRKLRIQVVEEFGFDADPVVLSFETMAFEPPDLRIEKVAINDADEGDAYGNGNSIVEPNESIVVTAFVQNYGLGLGENVRAKIILEGSDQDINCPDTGKIYEIGDIPAGDYRPIEFYFFTSRRYSSENIPIKIRLSEAKGDFGKIIDLGLKMNVRTENIVDVRVAKIEKPRRTVKKIVEIAKSDIDDITANSASRRPSGLAVIIGIEKYKYAPDATFASRDAEAFYTYATKVLGIPERNIYFHVDDGATAGEFMKVFDENGWLARRVVEESDIFVFYSGHGAPDLKSQEPFLIPYDIDPNYANTGYAVHRIYRNLGKLNARSATVIIDACFSGQGREKEMLLADARPLSIEVKESVIPDNVTVLTASSGSQISSSYPDQRHGLFSYYLMKGLKGSADMDGNKKICVGELYDYLEKEVRLTAGHMDREQTPELVTKNRERLVVEF